VLSWLEYDPSVTGPLPEVADVTYAWPIQGAAPRHLAIRKVKGEHALDAPLTEAIGPESPARILSLKPAVGPGVSLDPAFLNRGVDLFFAQYELPKPPDLADPLILAGIRPTAGGRSGRALGALLLKGGGIRVRMAVPVDAGLPVWGPRAADRVDLFAFKSAKGACEWLIDLE